MNRIVKKFGQGQVLVPGGTFEVHLEDCPASANNEVSIGLLICCFYTSDRSKSDLICNLFLCCNNHLYNTWIVTNVGSGGLAHFNHVS